MNDHLDSIVDSLPLAAELEINQLCREFEKAWRTGQLPRIEDLAGRMSGAAYVGALRELIAVEVALRLGAGQSVAPDEYHQRFPQQSAAVWDAWALLDDLSSSLGLRPESLGESRDGVPSYSDPSLAPASQPDTKSLLSEDAPETDGERQSVSRNRSEAPFPERLGRFEIERMLGRGGFGAVYLARDGQLSRHVALKVPHRDRFKSSEERAQLIEEARTAAQMSHPGIVTIHDVAQDGDQLFIVQEYVDGQDLAKYLTSQNPTPAPEQVARWMVAIAEAVAFAHGKGFVHRDLKPANILLDAQQRPRVGDFGLAVHETVQRRRMGERCGAPAYMSPEQVRGETHRLDGRSDIWSLGVILYELLTGRRPFQGPTLDDLFNEIKRSDPQPPQQIRQQVPPELERICLKCLSKRVTDRYPSALDLASDLQHWLAVGQQPSGALAEIKRIKIVPKGLRSFDAEDADFFLDLLPGPRDRDGLPESIRFWKTRLEETDADRTFAVGLVYGPSGCGKSSLVKAGLLPRLASHVLPIYVEATGADTEVRLLKGLRKECPEIPADVALPEVFESLREGVWLPRGRKIVIVLDQFEQWLHARSGEAGNQLIQALRHCDGGRVQCLFLVRDDFWLATSRFLKALEIDLLERQNCLLVDLFDPLHARWVLAEFGRAFGRISLEATGLIADQEKEKFLDRAVAGLAEDGKVICVRLAVFADMLKGRPWNTASLEQVGGTEGLGMTFLEETFSAATAPAEHRLHQQAARAVLKALLPGTGTNIKGGMRSHEELFDVSGYAQSPRDFGDLMRVLDGELRLITPTDPEAMTAARGDAKYYQLTHDYLVPSLREWLTRKQKETRRGRAELKLEERAAAWSAKPENRYLPSAWEYLSIVGLAPRKNWTVPQRRMMRKAGLVHLTRATLIVTLLVIAAAATVRIQRNFVEKQNLTRAQGFVDAIVNADTAQVPNLVTQLDGYAKWSEPLLAEKLAQEPAGSMEKLHLSLALAAKDDGQVEYLYEQLLQAEPTRFPVIRDALANHQARITDRLWAVLTSRDQDPEQQRLRAAGALAIYDAKNAKWNKVAPEVARQVVAVNPVFLGAWQDALRPAASHLLPTLAEICNDSAQGELSRTLATSLLADYAKNEPDTLTDVVLAADAKTFTVLYPVLAKHGRVAHDKLCAVLEQTSEPTWHDPPLDPAWREPEAAVKAAIEAAHGLLGERFAFCQDMLWEDFVRVAEQLRASGYRPTRARPWRAASGVGSLFRQSSPPVETALSERDSRPPSAGQVLVAAVWTRDSRRWQLQTNLTKEQLPAGDGPATRERLIPADAAALPVADPAMPPQFVVLWSEPAADEQRRLLVDLTAEQLKKAQADLPRQGFPSQSTIGVWTDAAGQRHYLGIWSNQGPRSELNPAYAGFELVEQPQWDVAVAPAAKLADPLDAVRQQLAQITKLQPPQLDQPQVRLARAQAQYQLGELEPALSDLDYLVEMKVVTAQILQYRAWTLARLGKADEARAELAKYLDQEKDPSTKAPVQIVLAAWLGQRAEVTQLLDSTMAAAGQNPDTYYNAACAAALASLAAAKSDAEQAHGLAVRALDLLTGAIAHGYQNAEQMRSDSDLAALHGDARFMALLEKLEPPARYAALWRADVDVESRLLNGLDPDSAGRSGGTVGRPATAPVKPASAQDGAGRGSPDPAPGPTEGLLAPGGPEVTAVARSGDRPQRVLQQARELAGQGYRPVAIAIDSDSTSTLVFHRPLVPDKDKEALAQQQATAAAALLKLEAGMEKIEVEFSTSTLLNSLFTLRPDPRVRSYLLHRLVPYGVDPVSLLTRLGGESDVSRRRALIVGLGEFARAKLLTIQQQAAVTADLVRLYGEDPDPGIHGVAEWTLRQLGATEPIAQVRAAYSTGMPLGDRQWYLTKTDGTPASSCSLTFAVLQPEEFLMGSPVAEVKRFLGPTGKNEIRHRRRIGRRFALGMHEVTVEQFQAFRGDHAFDRTTARELEAPANMVTWYDAAAYCNWLSAQEGIPRDQWGYDPAQEFQEGMTLNADYLQRTGYRLPTEAEWEVACRAGTTTARYFGETEMLLGEYAWYMTTSGGNWLLTVGRLKPNDYGLFDMLGNITEWCQDATLPYGQQRSWTSDGEQSGMSRKLSNFQVRELRGGSFSNHAPIMRSAHRSDTLPNTRSFVYGFRVARTYP